MTTINITQALCLTLVHSLWQGFLAAVAAGIIILSTRKSKAAVRYNLLTADLILFLLVTAFTFSHELGGGGGPVVGSIAGEEETAVLNGLQLPVNAGVEQSPGVIGQAITFMHTYASTVVLIWMLCLLGQLVQLMGGFYQMGQLRRRRVFAPGAAWQERLQVLAAGLGIRKHVDLIQSVRVNVPATFGFLKPSILVPLGMLANLPADQVEAVLLHELAHIRRNDYLANLLLHITESMFFFNPGIRWIASLIREEREACCDDMVLMGTADRNSYFDALVAFREHTISRQNQALRIYALQVGGKGKTDLLWRIRRMLNQENKKLHIMEKAILSFGLTAVLVIGVFSMRAAENQAEKRQVSVQATWQGTDTLPALAGASAKHVKVQFPSISTKIEDSGSQKKYKIDATDADGNTFELTKVNGAVTELVINGKAIPQEDFDQYLYIFEDISGRLDNVNEDQEEARQRFEEDQQEKLDEEQAKQQEASEKDAEKQQEIVEKQQEAREKAEAKIQEDADRQQEIAEKEAEKQQEIVEKQQEAQEKELARQQEIVDKQQEAADKDAEKRQEAYEKQQEAYEKQQEAYEKQNEAYEVQQSNMEATDQTVGQIVRDMIDLGLLGSRDAVHSFTLDNEKLVINGVRQSADMYQKLRVKYIKGANEHYAYSHSASGTTTDVRRERN